MTVKDMIHTCETDHFEVVFTPSSEYDNFDGDFLTSVVDTIQTLLDSFTYDPTGPLREHRYEEVASVCYKLKMEILGVQIDYERI